MTTMERVAYWNRNKDQLSLGLGALLSFSEGNKANEMKLQEFKNQLNVNQRLP